MHTVFHSLRRPARSFGLVTVGVLSTLGALSLTHGTPAQAQSPGVSLAQLVAQINALQSTVKSQAANISAANISSLQSKQTTDEQTISNAGNPANADYSSVSGGDNVTQGNRGGWSGGSYHTL